MRCLTRENAQTLAFSRTSNAPAPAGNHDMNRALSFHDWMRHALVHNIGSTAVRDAT